MDIFYITDESLDARSAETIHIHEICKNIAAQGHGVTLYAPVPKAPASHPTGEYHTVFINSSRPFFSIIFQVRLFFRLRSAVAKKRPTVIYSRHSHLLFMPALVANMFNIPLVLEVNGRLAEEARHVDHSLAGRVLIASGFLKRLESFNVRSAARLIAVTPGVKEYLKIDYRVDSAKIFVVANGVDIDFFEPLPRADARTALGLEIDPIYVGYLGSFYVWQGLHYIMRAAKLVLAQRPDIKFLIVGKGDETDAIKSFIQEEKMDHAIVMRPPVSHNQVATYINALDVCLCYPTKFRSGATSPFKVYEYLACGRAVVVSDIAGMREEFDGAVAYAEPESPEALAHVLISLIDNKDARDRLGKRGRAFVEDGHTWRAVAERIVDICKAAART
jgi:glycosyltransferase involved in cell wall biosynthesis